MLNKYAYHRMLFCLLGKHGCKILEDIVLEDNSDVIKERDYDEALNA